MKTKLILGLIVLAVAAFFPLSSLSKSNAKNGDTVTISGNNTLVLNGEVNGQSVGEVLAKAKELDAALDGIKEKYKGKAPLYLFLNSPGGSIQAGLELIEALKGLGRPVHTITLFSASMAFQIAQNLDDRMILQSGVLMSHHAAGEFSGSFGGQPTQLDSRLQLWLDRVRELDEQTVKRTGGKQTYDSYTKQYDHEMWLTGTKSVAQGYADSVVRVKCDSTLAGVSTKHLDFMGFDVSYDLDNCPLNTSPMNIHITAPGSKTFTMEALKEAKEKFIVTFEQKQKQVIPMYW